MNLEKEIKKQDENNSSDAQAVEIPFECVGEYMNIVPIGRGAQATVFRATSKIGQLVAIKCFDKSAFSSWKDEELLRREVDTIRELHVPGVPEYVDFVEEKRFAFLVESYIDAPSLAQRIEEGFRPTTDEVLKILTNVGTILQTLESRLNPIVHRDIKPANILIKENMEASIVDFGVVAAIRQHTVGMTFAGTAGYLAPEQLYNKVTPAADIFGLGMSVIHLITGVAPCDMDMDGLKPRIDKYIPISVPDALAVLLHDMIEPDPSHRIADAEELLKRLKNLDFRPLKQQKKIKKFNALTEEQKIAIRERVRKKKEEKIRKLALNVAGPNAKQLDPGKYKRIEKAHRTVFRRLNIYMIILKSGIIQFLFIILLVLFALGIDGVFSELHSGWGSIFISYIYGFITIASIISCACLSLVHHSQNRGFIKFPWSDWERKARSDNRVLNDMYRYALIDERSSGTELCEPKRLSELYWDMSVGSGGGAGEVRSSVQLPQLPKASGQDLADKSALPGKPVQPPMPAGKPVQPSMPTGKPVQPSMPTGKPVQPSKSMEAQGAEPSDKSSETPQISQRKTPRALVKVSSMDEYCIACPPQKLSTVKLIYASIFWVAALFFVFEIPFFLDDTVFFSWNTVIYYIVNLFFVGFPEYILYRYVKRDSICSPLYQERFKAFKKEFLNECRDCRKISQAHSASKAENH